MSDLDCYPLTYMPASVLSMNAKHMELLAPEVAQAAFVVADRAQNLAHHHGRQDALRSVGDHPQHRQEAQQATAVQGRGARGIRVREAGHEGSAERPAYWLRARQTGGHVGYALCHELSVGVPS